VYNDFSGVIINFLSNIAMFLHFHMAQQIAVKPKWCIALPCGSKFCTQHLYCEAFWGILFAPRQTPSIPHTHLATVHCKNKCSLFNLWTEYTYRVASPTPFRASPTALVSCLCSVKKKKLTTQNIDPTYSASRWSSILASYLPGGTHSLSRLSRARSQFPRYAPPQFPRPRTAISPLLCFGSEHLYLSSTNLMPIAQVLLCWRTKSAPPCAKGPNRGRLVPVSVPLCSPCPDRLVPVLRRREKLCFATMLLPGHLLPDRSHEDSRIWRPDAVTERSSPTTSTMVRLNFWWAWFPEMSNLWCYGSLRCRCSLFGCWERLMV
jgi:hypothetical protein